MITDPPPGVVADELARRARELILVRHSTALEGGVTDDHARAVQDEWAQGLISTDEMIARTRRLCGLPAGA